MEPEEGTTVEYHVWYNAPDGARRSLNALDDDGVQQIFSDVNADEERRQLLAQTVGLTVAAIEPGFAVYRVTTTVEQVEYAEA